MINVYHISDNGCTEMGRRRVNAPAPAQEGRSPMQDQRIPKGLCQCGCGGETNISKQHRRAAGIKKGEPFRYLKGHGRSRPLPENPYADGKGLCECGCGERAPLASKTDAQLGHKKGMPCRFILGHANRKPGPHWLLADRGYETPCWVWQLGSNGQGYGRYREVYEKHCGPVPEGLQLDHLCDVKACVNPTHLEPVTPAENVRRGKVARLTMEKARAIRLSPLTNREMAREYGVDDTTIHAIRKGWTWREDG